MLPDKTPPLKQHTVACSHSFGRHPNHVETRLTYNCAHLRSTKESLTDSVKKNFVRKFFCVKIFLGENLLGEHFLSEHFFFGENFFE